MHPSPRSPRSPPDSLIHRRRARKAAAAGSPVNQARQSRLRLRLPPVLTARKKKEKAKPETRKAKRTRNSSRPPPSLGSLTSVTSSLSSTTSSSSTRSTSSSKPTFLYLPLVITEDDRKLMISALLLAHFAALVAVLVLSGYATFRLHDLINSNWSLLSDLDVLDLEIGLLAGLNSGLALSHLAATAFVYLLTFNRYRISFIIAGHFNTAAWIATAVVSLTSVSAILLLLSSSLAAASYERLFLDSIKSYKQGGPRATEVSAKLDQTQIILKCCGARTHTDWFDGALWSDWLMPESACPLEHQSVFEKEKRRREKAKRADYKGDADKDVGNAKEEEEENGNGVVITVDPFFNASSSSGKVLSTNGNYSTYYQWPLIPFSCCNDSSKVPCLHFVPPEVMRGSSVEFLEDNNFLDGCALRFQQEYLWTVGRQGTGWALSAGVHLFSGLLLRYLAHSVTFSLLWARRADGPGLAWARGPSPKAIASLEVLVGGYQRLAWRWPVRLKKTNGGSREEKVDDQREEGDKWRNKRRKRRRRRR